MTTISPIAQQDEALRLLAQMYNRWFIRATDETLIDVYMQIRDLLTQANTQQDAYDQLSQCAETAQQTEELSGKVFARARDM
ncbi:MAG: hypothetical protein J2P37_35400, partial [Ktedonobacteraceae bacterium]|nr:hypothetical protein [Ktedonobacteraceae bacterium]